MNDTNENLPTGCSQRRWQPYARTLRRVVFLCVIGAVSAFAQAPDLQQLQEKMQQLEQMMRELKAQIAAATPAGTPATRPPNAETTLAPGAPEAPSVKAPAASEPRTRMDIYGAAMLDSGYEGKQSDPNWFDVMRPTKLPAFANQFGENGRWYSGVRQSRLGVKTFTDTPLGELKTIFEFELFGTGVDAGQTTFRLRHAWGELGQFGGGQTWSPFMDPDVFPNSIEYWGPNGMVFFRNVQFRWTPWQKGDSNFMIAAERPGASADGGTYADHIEIQNIKARFPMPDFSAHYRLAGDWGHVQVAGIVREIKWDDLLPDQFALSGSAVGWGVNLSSNFKISKHKHVLRLQAVYGHGVENYMNDAPVDVAVEKNPSNPQTPVVGKTLPVLGIVAFMDFNWSPKWTSTAGYSMLNITNSDGQEASAFKRGHYALANILYYPVPSVFLGPEIQWGRRINFNDGFSASDYRIQFSAKYNFKYQLGLGGR